MALTASERRSLATAYANRAKANGGKVPDSSYQIVIWSVWLPRIVALVVWSAPYVRKAANWVREFRRGGD